MKGLELSRELGGGFDNHLVFELGQRQDLITSGHLAATFRYAIGPFTGEAAFVTDQSCLNLFCQSLHRVLESRFTV